MIAVTLPILILATYVVLKTAERQRAELQEKAMGVVTALSVAIDLEFENALNVGKALATSEQVQRQSFEQLRHGLPRMLQHFPALKFASLLDLATGEVLIDSGRTMIVPSEDWVLAAATTVANNGAAAVFGVRADAAALAPPFIPIIVPVPSERKVTQLIFLGLDAESLNKIYRHASFDPGWTGAVIGSDFRIAARSRSPDLFVGREVTPPLKAALLENRSGFFPSVTQEGNEVMTAFVRSPVTGWAAVVGMPREDFDGLVYRTTQLIVVSAVIAVLVGGTLTLLVVMGMMRLRQQELALNARLQDLVDSQTAELRVNEQRYRTIVEDQTDLIVRFRDDGETTFINGAFRSSFGLEGNEKTNFFSFIHHDDMTTVSSQIKGLSAQDRTLTTIEARMIETSGRVHTLIWNIRVLPTADDGPREFQAVGRDMSEYRAIEEQLRQSQKMELVGQMTGGLAHDFNNLLAIIKGNTEFLRDRFGETPMDNAILRAVTRGAELTHRLLAYSRRQDLNPTSVDCVDLIRRVIELLRRTIGVEIQINFERSEGSIWPLLADTAQLENALLNLALNARDAMSTGGRLDFMCSNLRFSGQGKWSGQGLAAGDYVEIVVRDSGMGMSAETLSRVFEPFFTTKGEGKGTGLGLAVVYGFVKQSGGAILMESQLGAGTSVSIALPRSSETVVPDDVITAGLLEHGNGESILLVEDEPEVRSFVRICLESIGYRVLDCETATEALDILETGEEFDLILSDIRLPGGLNGIDFIVVAKEKLPNVKTLLMSGFFDVAATPASGLSVLKKPFSKVELAIEVRKAMAAEG